MMSHIHHRPNLHRLVHQTKPKHPQPPHSSTAAAHQDGRAAAHAARVLAPADAVVLLVLQGQHHHAQQALALAGKACRCTAAAAAAAWRWAAAICWAAAASSSSSCRPSPEATCPSLSAGVPAQSALFPQAPTRLALATLTDLAPPGWPVLEILSFDFHPLLHAQALPVALLLELLAAQRRHGCAVLEGGAGPHHH